MAQQTENKFNLSLLEALCIQDCGWSTEQDKELYEYAYTVVKKEVEKLRLNYQMFIIKNKLEEINK
jgi:hypothetical protein